MGDWKLTLADAVKRKVRRPLFAHLVGEHLRGYAHDASPICVSGAMLLPVREVVGLRPAAETKERRLAVNGHEAQLTFHDLRRYLDHVARAANTRILEELHSPHVILDHPAVAQLRALSQHFLTRLSFHDFRDRATEHRRRLRAAGPVPVSELLEAARLFMCGALALQEGVIESDIERLIERFEAHGLRAFLARHRAQGQGALLEAAELRLLEADLDGLDAGLREAHVASKLPDGVGSISGLDEFLVAIRLRDMQEAIDAAPEE